MNVYVCMCVFLAEMLLTLYHVAMFRFRHIISRSIIDVGERNAEYFNGKMKLSKRKRIFSRTLS